MNKFGFTSSGQIAVLDFALFNLAYLFCNFAKQGSFVLSDRYVRLVFIFNVCWLAGSLAARKFRVEWYTSYKTGITILIKSCLYMGYSMAFFIVVSGDANYSRLQIFCTCIGSLVLEILVWTLGYVNTRGRTLAGLSIPIEVPQITRGSKSSFFLLSADLVFVFLCFFAVNFFKRGSLMLPPAYDILLLILLALWAVSAIATGKFQIRAGDEYYLALWQWLKAGIFMLAMISVVVYGLRLFRFSRFQGFAPVLALMVIEAVFLKIYLMWQAGRKERDVESLDEVRQMIGQDDLDLEQDLYSLRLSLWEPVRDKLKDRLGTEDENLFDFIDRHIDLKQILCLETASQLTGSMFSLTSDRIPIRLFLSLDKINDIRRLNKYFLDTHRMLIPGGYYIGRAHTIATHREWIYANYRKEVAPYIYFLDFCFTRVMPKLPVIQKLYFAWTKGKNRVLSKAEILGRLSFCGFEIVAEQDIDRRLCFIARKAKTPAVDENPTYGPLVTLKRVGYNNDIVPIYKFRTMHPYSEYLQQYVVDNYGLQKGGKMDNDFRLTTWGVLMRKLWIDELPMLVNWLRGDLQIVGVRPLSVQYFSMYDDELKDLRKLVKPGLVPPYYADLPQTLEEIMASEKRYIRAFLKHRFRTQAIYFCKAFYNIIIKGARSK